MTTVLFVGKFMLLWQRLLSVYLDLHSGKIYQNEKLNFSPRFSEWAVKILFYCKVDFSGNHRTVMLVMILIDLLI